MYARALHRPPVILHYLPVSFGHEAAKIRAKVGGVSMLTHQRLSTPLTLLPLRHGRAFQFECRLPGSFI